jgi:hypothetical protein
LGNGRVYIGTACRRLISAIKEEDKITQEMVEFER